METTFKTRNASFFNLENLQKKEQLVYKAIQKLVKASNLDIANYLGWEINRVTGRTNRLRINNIIRVADTIRNPQSNRSMARYEIIPQTGQLSLF